MAPKNNRKLKSTITEREYDFTRIREWSEEGEPLEVFLPGIENSKIREGRYIFQRFSDFLPFKEMDPSYSLGEGNTPLTNGGELLKEFTGIDNILLKNETMNPTWSFKDRGSLACIWMAQEMGEEITATISTGNMGNSISAYGARAGIEVFVFVPGFTPQEKLNAMAIHGANIIKVKGPDYSAMKKKILNLAEELDLRVVSGNGPIRIEGYKMAAFELYEQLDGEIPDYIAVPTSACGHIRGIFKGFRELKRAGYIADLPKMIVVQAENNSPIVSAIKEDKKHIIPHSDFTTVAEAITSGSPFGGDEIIHKATKYNWLAEEVSEKEILNSQRKLAQGGFFVEPASATSLSAIKKLREQGKIKTDESVVLMLTGSGLKDFDAFNHHSFEITETDVNTVENKLADYIDGVR